MTTGDSPPRDGKEIQCKHIVLLCNVLILVLCRLLWRMSGLCFASRVAVWYFQLHQHKHAWV